MSSHTAKATRVLVWLRWRETVGRHGKLAVAALTCWCLSIFLILAIGPGLVDFDASGALLGAATGSWLAWAVAPLIGAGGNEVAGGNRLYPYPVGEPEVFWSTWATTLLDVPSLLILPATAGLSFAVAGFAGLAAAAAFAVAATAVGQAFAWTAAGVLSGRVRGWVALIGTTTVLMGGLGAAGYADDAARVLPGGWLATAAKAFGEGRYATWALLLAALMGVAVTATSGAYRAFTWSRRREAAAVSAKGASRPLPRGLAAALVAVWCRSMLRAPTARLLLAGTVVAPLLARLAEVYAMRAAAAVPAVALACSVSLGVNAFAFDGGGATLVMGAPVSSRLIAATKAVALWVTLLAGVFAAFAAAVVSRAVTGPFAGVPALVVAFTAALAGASVAWSARFPSEADHSSLRSRPAPLRSSLGFMVFSAITVGIVDGARAADGALTLPCGLALGALSVLYATRRLRWHGEAVAVAVSR